MIRSDQEDKKEPSTVFTKQREYQDLFGEFTTKESREIIKRENEANFAVISKPIIWSNGEVVTLQVSEQLDLLENTMTTLAYVLIDRKSTRLNSSHVAISYAVFCLKKKTT